MIKHNITRRLAQVYQCISISLSGKFLLHLKLNNNINIVSAVEQMHSKSVWTKINKQINNNNIKGQKNTEKGKNVTRSDHYTHKL